MTLYDRVRTWTHTVGLTDPKLEFLVMVEEIGELDDATYEADMAAIKDGIGDVAVTAIVVHQLLDNSNFYIEDVGAEVDEEKDSFANILGSIAEGLRKPKKRDQASRGAAKMLTLCQEIAKDWELDFEKDCLGPVVDIIEGRAAGGKLVDGTFVKEADL